MILSVTVPVVLPSLFLTVIIMKVVPLLLVLMFAPTVPVVNVLLLLVLLNVLNRNILPLGRKINISVKLLMVSVVSIKL